MNPAMWISKTGVQAQDAKLQAIANNLANANTVGFKRDRVVFEDLFYSIDQQPGAQRADNNTLNPSGVQMGNGTHLVGTQKIFTNGNVQTTNNALDVAVMGNGFLQVRRPNGEPAYTRAGQLQVDKDGVLVNASGLPLVPQITVPANATAITIGEKRYRVGHGARQCHADRTGPVDPDFVHQPDRPCRPWVKTCSPKPRLPAPPTEGRAGDAQFGKLKQGRAGRLQRAGGGRDGGHDRCPAHLRNEHPKF